MVRVLDKLRKYQVLYNNDPDDENTRNRIAGKLPFFKNMYNKLAQKTAELTFNQSIYDKTPSKSKNIDRTESTCIEARDYWSDNKSFKDNASINKSLKSLMMSIKTNNLKNRGVDESFDYEDSSLFDYKLNQIRDTIVCLRKMVQII